MLIFYGLGNNEAKYLQTKHNVGRLVLESIAASMQVTWQQDMNYYWSKTVVRGEVIYLVYSKGYMNHSGQPLSAFVNYYKLNFTDSNCNLIILHDDSDQLEGQLKLSLAGGSAGHKGVQSIYDHALGMKLPIEKIWRLKIGIRPKLNKLKSETFVLSPISASEAKFLAAIGAKVETLFSELAVGNFSKAQNVLNTKESEI